MGGIVLPTASTPGYGTITRNGRTFVGCDCQIASLQAGERLGLAKGLLREGLDLVQLVGDGANSGSTHLLGGVSDVKQYSDPWLHIWREMGWAFWPRVGADWAGNEHGHGVIDCPHSAQYAGYQITAYWRGYSGLGKASSGTYAGMWGYASKDPYPWRPTVKRSWKQGIAWADAETAQITAQEDDMQFSDKVPSYDLTVTQGLVRGAYAYAQVVEGGSIDKRLDAIEAALKTLADAVSKMPTAIDEKLAEAVVKVDVAVQYPQPPAAP